MEVTPIHLLLIEDNPADAKLIEIMLRESSQRYKLSNCTTFSEGLAKTTQEHYDLILLDLSLPDSFGIDTVKNAHTLAPTVPIIVLTGRDDEDFALEVVNAGAQDYLVKGQIEASLFSRAIRYAIKRKQLEVDLKSTTQRVIESQTQLNAIVSNSISGLVVLDLDGAIRFVNPSADRLLGDGHAVKVGQPFQYPYDTEATTEVIIEKTKLLAEITATKTIWGAKPAILVSLHDISDIKRAETDLTEKNKELTRINRSLDRFIYIISHDLKKPVANIQGLLGLLENDIPADATGRGRGIFDKLKFSANQLKGMIEDLLVATKKEISIVSSFEVVTMSRLYTDIITSIEELVTSTSAELHIDFVKNPTIFYSHQDMRSVMSNLITNALKYHSPNRIPQVYIWTEKSSEGSKLIVKDNGLGIDLTVNKDKLFTKYQRFHNHTEGTGLGLWLVKEILEKNGGSIAVESQLDVGTTFTVTF